MAQLSEEAALRHAEKIGIFSDRVVERAESKFEKGKNLFMARTMLSSIAASLTFSDYSSLNYAFARANEGIMSMLETHGAEGEVYAVREDLGNGYQDSTDFVRVTKRGEAATHAMRTPGQSIVIRALTPDTTSN
ncbi:MAG: hypothetical protein ABIP50_04030 [Candidatus Saccharimonadales bacterium]